MGVSPLNQNQRENPQHAEEPKAPPMARQTLDTERKMVTYPEPKFDKSTGTQVLNDYRLNPEKLNTLQKGQTFTSEAGRIWLRGLDGRLYYNSPREDGVQKYTGGCAEDSKYYSLRPQLRQPVEIEKKENLPSIKASFWTDAKGVIYDELGKLVSPQPDGSYKLPTQTKDTFENIVQASDGSYRLLSKKDGKIGWQDRDLSLAKNFRTEGGRTSYFDYDGKLMGEMLVGTKWSRAKPVEAKP